MPNGDSTRGGADVLLRMENVSKTFSKSVGLFNRQDGMVKAVDDVTFALYRGETLGLVGETGSGKSTLGRLALRLLAPDSGRIEIDGVDTTNLSRRRVRSLRRKAQMVFQDPYGSLDPRKKVFSIVAEPMIVHGLWDKDGKQRVAEIVSKVGLQPEHLDRYPHEFSGGQRQRIGIARAFAGNPWMVVADEPVSALDVSVAAAVTSVLMDIQRQQGTTLLFISHDLSLVRYLADRVVVMYLGHVMEHGTTDEIFSPPYHPYTEALLSAVPIADTSIQRKRIILGGTLPSAIDPPKGCPFHTRCHRKIGTICETEEPSEVSFGEGHTIACHLPAEELREMEPVIIQKVEVDAVVEQVVD